MIEREEFALVAFSGSAYDDLIRKYNAFTQEGTLNGMRSSRPVMREVRAQVLL